MPARSMDPSKRPVTMRQVAQAAGVDVSVVSRLLSGDDRLKISESTRERVMSKVRELDYRPNLAARALRTARGGLLAFVVPQFASAVNAPVISGAHRRARERGYSIVLGEMTEDLSQLLRDYRARGVDGVLVAGATLAEEQINVLADAELPVVLVNNSMSSTLSSAEVDYSAAARIAAEHLYELGHRRVVVLRGPRAVASPNRRSDLFEAAFRGLGGRTVRRVLKSVTSDGGAEAAGRLLTAELEVTALFTPTLMPALGVIARAHEQGRRIPEELSVMALHDAEVARLTWPQVSTVSLPMVELGATALDQVLGLVEGGKPTRTTVCTPPELIVRGTTAPPRSVGSND